MKFDANQRPAWRQMSAPERAIAYSPSSMVQTEAFRLIDTYRQLSDAFVESHGGPRRIAVEPREGCGVDVFFPPSEGPHAVHCFIHGGYWQQLGARDSLFAARDTLCAGIAFAAVDYRLAPSVSLPEIIDDCMLAIEELHNRATEVHLDMTRLFLSGSSAGAYLAAKCAELLPPDRRPAGLALISGIYELEPLVGTYINEALSLSVDQARELSLLGKVPHAFPPTLIAWGEVETDEFIRQSQSLSAELFLAGGAVHTLQIPDRNHFDVVLDLMGSGPLGLAFRELIGLEAR